MTLTEFLLARIAEDEEVFHDQFATASGEPEPGTWLAWGLAECEVKRRLVALALPGETDDSGSRARVLRILATVYSDHPDYLAAVYSDHPDYREERSV